MKAPEQVFDAEDYCSSKVRHLSGFGWLGIGVLALGWDRYCREDDTLTDGYRRQFKRQPILTTALTAMLIGHLTPNISDKIEKVDLIHHAARFVRK